MNFLRAQESDDKEQVAALLEATGNTRNDDSARIALAMARFGREDRNDALNLIEGAIKSVPQSRRPVLISHKAISHKIAERCFHAFAHRWRRKRQSHGVPI